MLQIKEKIFDLLPENPAGGKTFYYNVDEDRNKWHFKFGGQDGPEFWGSADDGRTEIERHELFLRWLEVEWKTAGTLTRV